MPSRRPGPCCIVLLLDSPDRYGYAQSTQVDPQALGLMLAQLRACWPRYRLLVSRCVPGTGTSVLRTGPTPGDPEIVPSPFFTDAKRLRVLGLPRGAVTAVVRPAALLLPASVLRAALDQARQARLDVTMVEGLPAEVFYVASARALAMADAAGAIAGAATIPLAIERLRAIGLSVRDAPLATARLTASDVGWQDCTLAEAIAAPTWKAWPTAALLELDSALRLAAALHLQVQEKERDRLRLRQAQRLVPGDDERRRSVLVTIPSTYQSGANAAWEELLAALPSHEIGFVCGRGTVLQRLLDARGFLTWQTHDGLAARSTRDAAVLLEAIATARPDVVHFDGAEGSTWASTVSAHGIGVVQHVRLNDVDRFEPAFVFADAIVAVASHLQQRIAARLGPAARVEHLADGVDLQRRQARARRRTADGRVRCLCVGRIEPEKGTMQVLAIVKALAALVPCDLLLVGSCGRDPAYCDAVTAAVLAAAAPLSATWRSFTHPIDALYAQADVVLVGSRNEALGMVGLEALAAGCLLVARRSAGYAAIIDESRAEGLLFEGSDDASLIAARVFTALGDRERFAANGRRKVETTFDARMTAQRLLALWHDVTIAPSRPAPRAGS